jgi:rhodanese-related sulfurtransferase
MKKFKLELSLISFVLFASLLTCTFSASGKDMVDDGSTTIKSIPVSEAKEMLDKSGVMFLDVREPDELQSGHAPGAINIPMGSVESQIGKQVPDKTTTLVVYCQGGRRSVTASQMLMKMGYKNVFNMEGGYKAWLKAGYPAK